MEKGSNFSLRISIALQERNISQSQLCEITNIPKGAMSQYVSGVFKPKQDRADIIAKALNVSPAWLMGYDVPMSLSLTDMGEMSLSEEEKAVVELFRKIPIDKQPMVMKMIEAATKEN